MKSGVRYLAIRYPLPLFRKQPPAHGVRIPMTIWQSLQWINRHSAPCALLTLMLMACAIAHRLAASMIALLSDIPLAALPPRLVRNITGIHFIDANWWFPLTYLLLFLATLIYMEIRSTPRWAVFITFLLISLPAIAYVVLCLRLG